MKSEDVSKYEFKNKPSVGFELKDHQINMRKNLFLIFAQDTKKTVSMLVNKAKDIEEKFSTKETSKKIIS